MTMNSNPESNLTLVYKSKWERQGKGTGFIFGETIPEQTITMELLDVDELTSVQVTRWFIQFLGALGYNTHVIQKGLAENLFADGISCEEQEWLSKEYDLTFNEDLDKYYTNRKETEAELDRINKNRGPMGTVLTTEESTDD
jgi:hypothetical protein